MGLPAGSKWLPLIVLLLRAAVTLLCAARKTRAAERSRVTRQRDEIMRGGEDIASGHRTLKMKDGQMLACPPPPYSPPARPEARMLCIKRPQNTLEMKRALFLEVQEEQEEALGCREEGPELNQRHVTWFKAATLPPPAG